MTVLDKIRKFIRGYGPQQPDLDGLSRLVDTLDSATPIEDTAGIRGVFILAAKQNVLKEVSDILNVLENFQLDDALASPKLIRDLCSVIMELGPGSEKTLDVIEGSRGVHGKNMNAEIENWLRNNKLEPNSGDRFFPSQVRTIASIVSFLEYDTYVSNRLAMNMSRYAPDPSELFFPINTLDSMSFSGDSFRKDYGAKYQLIRPIARRLMSGTQHENGRIAANLALIVESFAIGADAFRAAHLEALEQDEDTDVLDLLDDTLMDYFAILSSNVASKNGIGTFEYWDSESVDLRGKWLPPGTYSKSTSLLRKIYDTGRIRVTRTMIRHCHSLGAVSFLLEQSPETRSSIDTRDFIIAVAAKNHEVYRYMLDSGMVSDASFTGTYRYFSGTNGQVYDYPSNLGDLLVLFPSMEFTRILLDNPKACEMTKDVVLRLMNNGHGQFATLITNKCPEIAAQISPMDLMGVMATRSPIGMGLLDAQFADMVPVERGGSAHLYPVEVLFGSFTTVTPPGTTLKFDFGLDTGLSDPVATGTDAKYAKDSLSTMDNLDTDLVVPRGKAEAERSEGPEAEAERSEGPETKRSEAGRSEGPETKRSEAERSEGPEADASVPGRIMSWFWQS